MASAEMGTTGTGSKRGGRVLAAGVLILAGWSGWFATHKVIEHNRDAAESQRQSNRVERLAVNLAAVAIGNYRVHPKDWQVDGPVQVGEQTDYYALAAPAIQGGGTKQNRWMTMTMYVPHGQSLRAANVNEIAACVQDMKIETGTPGPGHGSYDLSLWNSAAPAGSRWNASELRNLTELPQSERGYGYYYGNTHSSVTDIRFGEMARLAGEQLNQVLPGGAAR